MGEREGGREMKKGRGEEREGGRVRLGERKEKRQQEGRDYVYIFLLLVWDILPGFVLCDPSSPCHMGQRLEAQIAILEYKSIICAGYSAVLHIHSVVEEVQISVSLPENSLVLHVPQPQRLGVGNPSFTTCYMMSCACILYTLI